MREGAARLLGRASCCWVAALLLSSCGGDECSPSGLYVCGGTVRKTSCPAGYPLPSGETSFAMPEERCGNLVQTTASEFGDAGCIATCDVEDVYGGDIDFAGHCVVKCQSGFICDYWFDGSCSRR